MSSVGVMASSVVAGNTVLLEPFNDFTTNGWVPGTATIVAARTGNGARTSGTTAVVAKWAIPAPSQSAYATIGFAVRTSALPAGQMAVLRLLSSGATTSEVGISFASGGAVNIVAAVGLLVASAAGVVTAGTYYYVELTAYNHDTAGFATARVNGVQVATVTGIDTKAGGTVYDGIGLCGAGSGVNNIFDDLYLTMGAGAAFKGDITIP